MGHQLYCVVYKEESNQGITLRPASRRLRRYIASERPEGRRRGVTLVQQKLEEKMPLWQARNIVPDEEIDPITNDIGRISMYGMKLWREMFAPRQLFGHCVASRFFRIWRTVCKDGPRPGGHDLCRAGYRQDGRYNSTGLSVAPGIAKCLSTRLKAMSFRFKWSYAEMAPTIVASATTGPSGRRARLWAS
jgi:hypothetical protein